MLTEFAVHLPKMAQYFPCYYFFTFVSQQTQRFRSLPQPIAMAICREICQVPSSSLSLFIIPHLCCTSPL